MNPPIDMTLRDYFAAKAAQTFVQGASADNFDALAVDAYRFAESMLKARNTPQAQRKPLDLTAAIEYADQRWSGANVPVEWCRHFVDALDLQSAQEPSGWQKIECPICGDMAIATDIPATQPAPAQHEPAYTYTSTQATRCARCGEHKHTPLRIDSMGGYVCLTCIDKQLCTFYGEFGYPEPAPVPGVVLRDGRPTLLRDRDIKTTDVRLCVIKENP